jgi:hypothetical protein
MDIKAVGIEIFFKVDNSIPANIFLHCLNMTRVMGARILQTVGDRKEAAYAFVGEIRRP